MWYGREVIEVGEVNDSGADLYLSPISGLCLPFGKHIGILTYIQTLSTKK